MEAVPDAMILNLIKSALRNKIFWYLVSRYLTFGIQFISSIYIAVKLGAYYFGIWSFVLLLINIGNQFNWGIGNALNIIYVQNKNDQTKCRCYCFNAMLLTFLIMIPVILFTLYERIFGFVYFQKYQLGNMIYGIALVICLNYVNTLLMNISRVKGHVFAIAFNQSVFPVLTLILMFCTNGMVLLYLLLGGYVVAMLLSALLYLIENEITWSEKVSWNVMCEIARKGLYLFFYNTCFYLIVLSTKTIVSYYYSVEEFGYFAFAFGLANAAMMLIDSLVFLAFPKMIDMMRGENKDAIQQKIDFLRTTYCTAVSCVVYLAIPCCYFLLKLVPKYQHSFPYFTGILLSLAVYSNCFGYNTYLLAKNKEKTIAICAACALLSNIILTYFLSEILHLGLEYCVCGLLITYFAYTLAVNQCAQKELWKNKKVKIRGPGRFCALVVPFLITFILLYANLFILMIWLPFVSFSLLNIKHLKSLFNQIILLIFNQKRIELDNNIG